LFIRSTSLIIAALLAGTAVAAPETYTIDPRHTFPSFEVNHLGFSTQRGRFNSTSGTIVLDRAARSASVEVSIDVRSINTGLDKLEQHLVAEDFFYATKYPKINFKSTHARFEGDKLVALDGDLTMRGVTRPVTLTMSSFYCGMHPILKKPACGADAMTMIKRSDYGINYALPAVGDDVKLLIQVEAHKQ
jgi:polyisoprenoid-binding protein YceI